MIAEFKICKSGNCGITITGLELDNDSYLQEDAIVPHFKTYKWTQSITLNAIHSVNAQEIETLIKYEVKDHNEFPIDDSTFSMPKDGIYALNHLIIPSKLWLDDILEKDPSALSQYTDVVYFNTTDTKFYNYVNGESIEIEIPKVFELALIEKSTIVNGLKNTFNLCYLNDCFFKLNKTLLSLLAVQCKTSGYSKELIYKRDLIWMALNTIKYAIETQQLFEAQRILDNINTCHSICDSHNNFKYNSCGCN